MGLIVGFPITHRDMNGLDPKGKILDPNPINIGNDVWIGKDVSIFGGVTIGNGCIIGAKALVNKDCVPYGIYGGIPAKLIRLRFSEDVIEQLLDLKWWDWSTEKLRANATFFDTDFTTYQGRLSDLVVEPALASIPA